MINKIYLEKIEEIKKSLNSNPDFPSTQLNNFLVDYSDFKKKVEQLRYKKDVDVLHHKLSKAEINIPELKEWLSKILGKKITHTNFTAHLLEWRDYLIMNDDYEEKPGIDVIFDLTKDWNSKGGGQIIYVDGTGEYYAIPISENSLTIVERKKGVQKFFKYLNNLAKNNKRFFLVLNIF
ncbi:hypothetical protein HY837_06530 [archaeon]|nr:hypothetical protein [archaeon]